MIKSPGFGARDALAVRFAAAAPREADFAEILKGAKRLYVRCGLIPIVRRIHPV
jgi:hypothetical protein